MILFIVGFLFNKIPKIQKRTLNERSICVCDLTGCPDNIDFFDCDEIKDTFPEPDLNNQYSYISVIVSKSGTYVIDVNSYHSFVFSSNSDGITFIIKSAKSMAIYTPNPDSVNGCNSNGCHASIQTSFIGLSPNFITCDTLSYEDQSIPIYFFQPPTIEFQISSDFNALMIPNNTVNIPVPILLNFSSESNLNIFFYELSGSCQTKTTENYIANLPIQYIGNLKNADSLEGLVQKIEENNNNNQGENNNNEDDEIKNFSYNYKANRNWECRSCCSNQWCRNLYKKEKKLNRLYK